VSSCATIDAEPEFETPMDRFATWLARLDDDRVTPWSAQRA
jgi:hypothetical protein